MLLFIVTVGSPPEVLVELSDTVVVSPESLSLECKINPGEPTAALHWYKETKELKKSNKCDMTYAEEVATLVLKETENKDSGMYRCEAVNKLGHVSTQCRVNVYSEYKLRS